MSEKLEWTDYLERIATALEESNAITRQWVAQQAQWHEEVEQINAEVREQQRNHEQRVFEQTQEWMEWQKEQQNHVAAINERRAKEMDKAMLNVYEESLLAAKKSEEE